jgi:hypothetical protein
MCVAKADLKVDVGKQFPHFSSIEIDDKKIIQGYAERFQPLSCEYSFANIYCWKEPYQNLWGIYKERLVVYDAVNKCSFFPLGEEVTPEELALFSQEMKRNGMGADIGVVPSSYLEKYPEINEFYTIIDERDSAEYIYSVEALCDLKGSKLHKKKNLISQFHRKYPNSSVKLMTGESREKTKTLAEQIYNSHERFLHGIENEHIALIKALDDFEEIGLEGLELMVGDDLMAFSIFSPLNHDTYDIHFEKACYQFKGAAQVINHETAKYLKDKCQYLNREQDLGIQGLRQAKMSYDPETLFMTHILAFKQ